MKGLAILSIVILLSACTVSLKHEVKKDGESQISEKEIFIGPKIGKE